MAQAALLRRLFTPARIVAGIAAAILQGWLVFLWQEFPGPFLSLTGFKCVAVPLFVEAVVAVVAFGRYDELHARAISNPHSLLGQALRDDAGRPPDPPPTREAWNGGFAPMDEASDKMSKGR
jgi:hypothetical protein